MRSISNETRKGNHRNKSENSPIQIECMSKQRENKPLLKIFKKNRHTFIDFIGFKRKIN